MSRGNPRNARKILQKALERRDRAEGMEPDADRDLQIGFAAAVYAVFLQRHCGWTLENLPLTGGVIGSREPFATLIDTTSKERIKIPVIACSASYTPFDATDPMTNAIKAEMEGVNDRAIILFGTPIAQVIARNDGRIQNSVIFGGLFYEDGTWSHFVLSKGGIADIRKQRQYFTSNKLSRGFFRDFGFTDFDLFYNLARDAMIAGQRSTVDVSGGPEKLTLQPATMPSGWMVLLSSAFADAMQTIDEFPEAANLMGELAKEMLRNSPYFDGKDPDVEDEIDDADGAYREAEASMAVIKEIIDLIERRSFENEDVHEEAVALMSINVFITNLVKNEFLTIEQMRRIVDSIFKQIESGK